MTNSIQDISESSQCIFVIGSNTTEQHPVIGSKIRRAKRMRGAKLIVADPRRIQLSEIADLYLQHRPGTDIALLNAIMHVIIRDGVEDKKFIADRTENFNALQATLEKYDPETASRITGVPAADIVKAAHMMAENRPGSLLYAMGITQHTVGVANVMSCANLQMVLGNMGVAGGGVNPLRGQNNVQGACDMGGLPNVYPGYQKVTDPAVQAKFEKAWGVPLDDEIGLTITEMFEKASLGEVKSIYIIGENPLVTDPDLNHLQEKLSKTEFVVVQDIFFTETCQFADVILPGVSFAEKEGTFTNTERRIQRVRQAIPPVGESKLDSWIVSELAKRMIEMQVVTPNADAQWADWGYIFPSEIMEEINALTPIYGGVTFQRLDNGEPLQWPVLNKEHPGTPILHAGKFSRGLGCFAAVDHMPPAEIPDEEYPFMLTTGRVIYHWHGGEMTRRASNLNAIYPQALVEINPLDAHKVGINDGAMLKMASRRGEIVVKPEVTDRVPPGLVFATFHFPETSANFLTNAALDPKAKIPEYKVCAVKLEALAV